MVETVMVTNDRDQVGEGPPLRKKWYILMPTIYQNVSACYRKGENTRSSGNFAWNTPHTAPY